MLNVLNKHNTLTNFYHPNNHIIFPKNDYNYISKAKQEYNILIHNIERKRKNNIRNNSKNRLLFHSTNRNLNCLDTNTPNSRKNIATITTSINFWKGRNNMSKFNYDNYLEKNNKRNIVLRNNYLYNSFNTNDFKSEKEASKANPKIKINSKLFELFINDYEKRIKKSLEEIGENSMKSKDVQPENEKTSNKEYNNYENFEKNFYNLPFLNNNEEKNKDNNKINFNSGLENINNEDDKNNSFNGNVNKIFQNEPGSSRLKSTNMKRLINVNSFGSDNKKEDVNEHHKKLRTISSSPYTINTTIKRNLNTHYNSKKIENKISYYEIGKIIGKGAYSVVKLCKNKITQEKFAMKIYEKKNLKDHIIKKCISKEIEILKKLNHPNIVKLYDVIYTDKNIFLIQELVDGKSLREFYNLEIRNQKNISENKFKLLTIIFKQILLAFDYIHKKGIAHRDIKLENILLTKNNEIKIIDFGFGMYNPRNTFQKFFCGTPNYMAPEIILKKEYNGQKADIWSLGILIYKLFCADFPFKGKNQKELYNQIIKGKFKIRDYVPECVKIIIEKMIKVKPSQRISCEQALLSHWLKN